MMKALLAGSMLVSAVLGMGGIAGVETANAAVAPAASTATAKPVMDNLSSYGLKKDVELPVTVSAGGLSYTLHKVMIFDYESTAAKALQKQYDFKDYLGLTPYPEYLIWTKITIKNDSKKIVQHGNADMSYKWRIYFENENEANPVDAAKESKNINSKAALYDFKLQPGQSLTTYQALYYKGNFDQLEICLYFNGGFDNRYVVNAPEKTK